MEVCVDEEGGFQRYCFVLLSTTYCASAPCIASLSLSLSISFQCPTCNNNNSRPQLPRLVHELKRYTFAPETRPRYVCVTRSETRTCLHRRTRKYTGHDTHSDRGVKRPKKRKRHVLPPTALGVRVCVCVSPLRAACHVSMRHPRACCCTHAPVRALDLS